MSAIGIDLGTTNSCVAVYRKNQVEIIVNDDGKRVTPSVVSFTEDERLVGEAAQSEAPFNFENTIFQVKRIIGRTYDDPIVQADMKLWGFTVINDDNKPKIPVISSQGRKIFCPEEISAMVLESLKSAAKARLDEPVTDAVITVPAYFNDAQRKATIDAGKIAGLNVLRVINEPTAAAIAYGLDRKSDKEQNVLVFDLGGGTFDLTIVKINKTKFEVQATGGDTHLGGDDFDNRMVEHFVAEFNSKNKCDMSDNKLAMNRLRVSCEAAKRKLSFSTMATVQVDGLHKGLHLRSKISRAKFEELNNKLFTKLTEVVDSTLLDADMKKEQIDIVVLVGGSTRIPKVHELLKDFFSEKKINKTINPDEAVAYGAAALAANLSSKEALCSEIEELKLQDVTPLSLGWKNSQGMMVVVVKRNTKIPTQQWCESQTGVDNMTSASLMIYEGERAAAGDNHFLGKILTDGIPPALRGVEKFKTCFAIDQNGILTVTDYLISTGVKKQITIDKKGRLSSGEVLKMKIEAEKFKEEDELWKKKCQRANILGNFVYKVKHAFDDETFLKGTTDRDRKTIIDKCNKITEWLDLKKGPEISDTQRNEQELETICRPIFNKIPEGLKILEKMKK